MLDRKQLLRLKRLRFDDDLPMLLETRFIQSQIPVRHPRRSFTGSLYVVYQDSYDIQGFEGQTKFGIVYLSEKEANCFTQVGDPGLPCHRCHFFRIATEPIEYRESLYRGDGTNFR